MYSGDTSIQCGERAHELSPLSMLRMDFKLHAAQKQFQCGKCGKIFRDKTKLSSHVKGHTKPYKCVECGEGFSRKDILTKHIRIHTDEKPFKCGECGMDFRQINHLTYHERIHSGERPYRCFVCGEHFSRKGNLKKHVRIHTGERPFQCEKCGKAFNQKSHLNKHLNKVEPCAPLEGSTTNPATISGAKSKSDLKEECQKLEKSIFQELSAALEVPHFPDSVVKMENDPLEDP